MRLLKHLKKKVTPMPDDALQAVAPAPATDTSTPATEVKEAEKGATGADDADKGSNDDGNKEGEAAKDKPPEKPMTEADKIRAAMQKRIDRQTAASKAQNEQIQRLNAELQRLAASQPQQDKGAPKEDDYNSWEEYDKARVEYEADRRANERLKTEKEAQLKQMQERQALETRKKFEAKEREFQKSAPDYDAVAGEAVAALRDLGAAGHDINALRDIVMQFDNPPQMLYELGKDTNLIDQLVTMQPMAAMRELVKLEIALQGAAKPAENQAPEPIKPVGGRAGVKALHERSGSEILEWAKGKKK